MGRLTPLSTHSSEAIERTSLLPTAGASPPNYGTDQRASTPPAGDQAAANEGSADAVTTVDVSPFYDPLKLSDRFKSPEELERIRKTQPGPVYDFYVSQNSHIEELLFTSPENRISGQSTPFENSLQAQLENDFEAEEARLRKVQWAVHLSVGANVVLFLVQLAAAISSGSLSLFATMADAFMDLLSSVILLMTSWAMAKRNQVKYPTGKARLETGGIIVFSSLMATLSVQLIVESIKSLISGEHEQNVTWFSIISIMGAWVTKFGLYLYCQALNKYPSARILAQDHFNDLIVNAFGLTMCLLGTHMSWWIDPVGGILVALIILRSWSLTAFEHVILIVGKTADPAFLQKITYIALTHDPRIMEIDTCRAYHLGHNLYVEVDIVMPPETPLHVSHDIGESLQFKLEKLDNVERAFVHVDYESEHHPEHNGERSV